MIELRDFNTAAEMRAHYKAVRARIFGPPPPPTLRPPPRPARPTVTPPPMQIKPLSAVEIATLERATRTQTMIAARREARSRSDVVLGTVAAHFDVTVKDMTGPGRKQGAVLDARFVACVLLQELYLTFACLNPKNALGLSWVGLRMKRDHSTVFHALKRVKNSPRLLKELAEIKAGYIGKDGPYVEIESYVRHENETYTLKRTSAGVHL